MSIYDVFNKGKKEENTDRQAWGNNFDKRAWSEQKQAQRKDAYELIDKTTELIATNPQAFKQYLEVQSQFDRYTPTNAILVSAQMPEATQLKSYEDWKKKRVYLNPSAKDNKITILEPGKLYERQDGTTATSFNAKIVYDVSHTTARIKTEDMEQKPIRELLTALIEASPVGFQPIDDLEVTAYYNDAQQTIYLRKDLSEVQLFNSMTLAVASAIYELKHNEDPFRSEFKSYCVSYMLSHKYGVDTSAFSFEQLPPELAELRQQEFRGDLNSMRDVLGEIHKEMYQHLEKDNFDKNNFDKNKSEKNRDQER